MPSANRKKTKSPKGTAPVDRPFVLEPNTAFDTAQSVHDALKSWLSGVDKNQSATLVLPQDANHIAHTLGVATARSAQKQGVQLTLLDEQGKPSPLTEELS